MATKSNSRSKSREQRIDPYEKITAAILEALEAGVVPWRRPWKAIDAPQNLVSKRPYRGINVFLLQATAQARGYSSPFWATYKQISERGGQVRKGEKATQVVLWKWVERTKENEQTGEEETRRVPFLRLYSVFNTDQADGLSIELPTERDHDPIEAAEAIVAGYVGSPAGRTVGRGDLGPTVRHGGDAAYYSPDLDLVAVPRPESFENAERYYAVVFHELAHSTGHASRIDRKLEEGTFGNESYSREELLAEISACFLLSESSIEVDVEQPAAYIACWIRALQDDPKLVVNAAAGAQKAVDWILDRKPANEKEEQ